jgi:hypothetical protein
MRFAIEGEAVVLEKIGVHKIGKMELSTRHARPRRT